MIGNIILLKIRKKIEKGTGFKVNECNFDIKYIEGTVYFKCNSIDGKKSFENTREVKDFSDMSEIILNKINTKIKAKQIDRMDINIFFESKKQTANVYYVNLEGVKKFTKVEEVI